MGHIEKMAAAIESTEDYCDERPKAMARVIFDALMDAVPDLDMPERRNGYWGHKHGYQIAYTHKNLYRVRLNGRVICRDINGFDRAIIWANAHHRKLVSEIWGGKSYG